MARSVKVTCDKCGAVRGESNHWLVVVMFRDWRFSLIAPAEHWAKFEEEDVYRKISEELAFCCKDACGRECALALQETALDRSEVVF